MCWRDIFKKKVKTARGELAGSPSSCQKWLTKELDTDANPQFVNKPVNGEFPTNGMAFHLDLTFFYSRQLDKVRKPVIQPPRHNQKATEGF